MPLPQGSPPAPRLSSLLPPSTLVSRESWVRLTNGTPQVVITDSSRSPKSPDGTARDLLVLSWDSLAGRWLVAFDAAKTRGSMFAPATFAILPPDAAVTGLRYAPIESRQGRTDLAFWSGVNFGANAPFAAYILHDNGRAVSLAYSSFGEDGSASVIGRAPTQRLSLTYQWISPVDPECCAVRNYTQQVGWRPGSAKRGGAARSGSYAVVSDTRSWLGVYVAIQTQLTGRYPPPVVMTVVPGSPAAGVLQPGDELLSVAGVTLPADNSASLGPAVVDEVDVKLPNTVIALTIERAGQQLTEHLRLSSYANPAQLGSSAPTPGFLGVESQSTTGGVAITEVSPGSPADGAGLAVGDVITGFGSAAVTDEQDFQLAELLSSASSTRQITFVDPTGQRHSVAVKLGTYPTDGSVIPPEVAEI